jgi:hypothetical protein
MHWILSEILADEKNIPKSTKSVIIQGIPNGGVAFADVDSEIIRHLTESLHIGITLKEDHILLNTFAYIYNLFLPLFRKSEYVQAIQPLQVNNYFLRNCYRSHQECYSAIPFVSVNYSNLGVILPICDALARGLEQIVLSKRQKQDIAPSPNNKKGKHSITPDQNTSAANSNLASAELKQAEEVSLINYNV